MLHIYFVMVWNVQVSVSILLCKLIFSVCYVHDMYVAQVLAAAALRILKVINRQFSVITCCELGMWWVDRNGNGTKVSESSLFHQGHAKSNLKGFPIDNPLHSIPKTIGKSKLESPKIRICRMVCDGPRCLLSMIWNLWPCNWKRNISKKRKLLTKHHSACI